MRPLSLLTLAAALGTFAPAAARGQEPTGPRVTLGEVLSVAVRQSPTIAAAGLDLAIAQARVLEAQGLDDWILDGSATWQSARRDIVENQTFQQPETDNLSLSGGVTRPLPSGGRVGVSFDAGWTRARTRLLITDPDTGVVLPPIESTTHVWAPGLGLSLSQPLLRGAGKAVARAPQRQARVARDAAALQREATAADVVRQIVVGYWELAYASEDMEIRRQALALAQEQLRNVQAGIEVGRLARTAAAEVEAAIALRQEEILLAEQVLSERALDVRRLAGMPIGPRDLDLVAADRTDVEPVVPDVDRSLEAAYAANPQVAAAAMNVKAASISVEVAQDALLPQLDFSASAGPVGNSGEIDEALRQLVTWGSYTLQAGLTFSVPVERRAAKGQLARARYTYQRARLDEADLRAQIAVSVVRAVNAVRSAKLRMDALAKATELAQVNLETEQARYEVGRATSFDVLMRQSELSQARLRQARARIDYLEARAALEALTGEILQRYGIEVK